MILNAGHPDDPKPLPTWITESPDSYATLKRPLPESKNDMIYVYDTDYRCDPRDEPDIYDTNSLSFKIDVQNPIQSEKEIIPLATPPSSILKNTRTTLITPVMVTSTPIVAENIICIEDKTILSRQARQQRENTLSPPSLTQTAPTS